MQVWFLGLREILFSEAVFLCVLFRFDLNQVVKRKLSQVWREVKFYHKMQVVALRNAGKLYCLAFMEIDWYFGWITWEALIFNIFW